MNVTAIEEVDWKDLVMRTPFIHGLLEKSWSLQVGPNISNS